MSEQSDNPSETKPEDEITETDLDSVAGGGSGTYTLNCAFTSNCSGAEE